LTNTYIKQHHKMG